MMKALLFSAIFAIAHSASALTFYAQQPQEGMRGFSLDVTTSPTTAHAVLQAVDSNGTTYTGVVADTTTGALHVSIGGLAPRATEYHLYLAVNTVKSLTGAVRVDLGKRTTIDLLTALTVIPPGADGDGNPISGSLEFFIQRCVALHLDVPTLIQAAEDTARYNLAIQQRALESQSARARRLLNARSVQ